MSTPATEKSVAATTDPDREPFSLGDFVKKYAIVFILIGFVVLLAFLTGGSFLQTRNLLNVIVQVAPIGIIAFGMTFIIITNGIDLSVGSTVALSAVIACSLAQIVTPTSMYPNMPALPIILPVLVGILVGAATGFVNGFLVSFFKIAPFIATLGMMTAARGLALIYTDGRPISGLAPGYNAIGQGSILGIPVPVILLVLCAILAHILLNYTRFGRHTYAIGGNEQAAHVSGINIARVRLWIFTFTGALAGLAGIILSARIGSGNPQLGNMMELDVITATVIGGTSFNGGVGTIWGTIVGALIIGVINNGMDLLNVSPFWQLVVKGAIIVVAIIIDERKNR
ncbi:ribose import permease protein RbsC [Mobilicoccus caccae]|uniref:Ribose import permease protein RbsC n=1 Tax=Mobilicoccus caccae TaxID=1859295 RepID=A0ABQ6IYF3_9MICO|nr:ribose import permease protein RbsC [Mobilicoccus caccae]